MLPFFARFTEEWQSECGYVCMLLAKYASDGSLVPGLQRRQTRVLHLLTRVNGEWETVEGVGKRVIISQGE